MNPRTQASNFLSWTRSEIHNARNFPSTVLNLLQVIIITDQETISKGSMSDAREIVRAILDRVLIEMEIVTKEVLQEDAMQEDAISILEFPSLKRMEFNWTEIDPIYKG